MQAIWRGHKQVQRLLLVDRKLLLTVFGGGHSNMKNCLNLMQSSAIFLQY